MKPDCFQPHTFFIPLPEIPLNPPGGALDFQEAYGDFFSSKNTGLDSSLPDLFNESTLGSFNFPEDSISVPQAPTTYIPSSNNNLQLNDLKELSSEELQELIEKKYQETPTSPPKVDQAPIFRWLKAPPERVHATSPSKLTDGHRPGGSFSFSVQLVSQCEDGSFIPYKATSDIHLVVNVCGKNKFKSKSNDEILQNDLVILKNNPIGKPLLVVDSRPKDMAAATIKQGDSSATFSGISLTCGSNAARSRSAPEAAKDWDWDYFIQVETDGSVSTIRPLLSQHITTDSNRSQTREKKKREREHDFGIPPAKRAVPNFPIAPYFFQPLPPSTVSNSQFTFQNSSGPFSQFLMT